MQKFVSTRKRVVECKQRNIPQAYPGFYNGEAHRGWILELSKKGGQAKES